MTGDSPSDVLRYEKPVQIIVKYLITSDLDETCSDSILLHLMVDKYSYIVRSLFAHIEKSQEEQA